MGVQEYCIVSAGVGSRFKPFSNYANKALAPVPFTPLICKIIDKIPPDATIHIVVGYKGKDLKHILMLYYPNRKLLFYENNDYKNTGMGDSLTQVLRSTSNPLLIMPNDGIYETSLDQYVQSDEEYAIGCQAAISNKSDYLQIAVEKDTSYVNSFARGSYTYDSKLEHDLIFSGLLYIKNPRKFLDILCTFDAPREIYNPFSYLLDRKIPIKVFNVSWIDCGTYDKYKEYVRSITPYDFSKTAETLLLKRPLPVVKIFQDPTIAIKRVKKSSAFPDSFPKCNLLPSKSGYSYQFVEGTTLYDSSSESNLKNLLDFLSTNLWKYTANTSLKRDAVHFYQKKTEERIKLLKSKYDLGKIKYINGDPIFGNHILPNFPYKDFIESVYPSPIHGDLQYDNCLITPQNTIVLLDWRHEFGSNNLLGDLYYDMAKLLGGIYINYKRIKESDFSCELNDKKDEILYSYKSDEYFDSHILLLKKFIYSKNLSYRHCKLLMCLVFVNMSPLHEYPFDLFLLALSHQIYHEHAF